MSFGFKHYSKHFVLQIGQHNDLQAPDIEDSLRTRKGIFSSQETSRELIPRRQNDGNLRLTSDPRITTVQIYEIYVCVLHDGDRTSHLSCATLKFMSCKAKVCHVVTYTLEIVRFAHSGIKTQGKELFDHHQRVFPDGSNGYTLPLR